MHKCKEFYRKISKLEYIIQGPQQTNVAKQTHWQPKKRYHLYHCWIFMVIFFGGAWSVPIYESRTCCAAIKKFTIKLAFKIKFHFQHYGHKMSQKSSLYFLSKITHKITIQELCLMQLRGFLRILKLCV